MKAQASHTPFRRLTAWMMLAFCAVAFGGLKAQQLEVANNHIFSPGWINPGHVSTDRLYRASLLHQQRHLIDFGWRSTSQFLDFRSSGLGRKRAFGFGMNIGGDFEHTESKFNINFAFGAKVIQTEYVHLGVGMNLGLVNWASNYVDVPVFQQGDPLLNASTNSFTDLDAGLGISFDMKAYSFRTEVDIWGRQIPGSFLSSAPNAGAVLAPHVYAAGNFLYNLGPDVFLGPAVFYRNVFSSDFRISGIRQGHLDVGAKLELDYPRRMWAGAAYRLNNAAATVNFGMQILGTDTADGRLQISNFLDMIVSASYPLNGSSVFGPSAEIGVAFTFGQTGSAQNDIDTIGKIRGAFWANNGNMDTHKDRHLNLQEPKGLKASTVLDEENVFLEYEWDDMHYLYAGYNFAAGPDSTVERLGVDWVGMDDVVEGMVNEVVREALHPANLDYERLDSVEPLKELIALGLAAKLKFDQNAAEFGVEGGMKYEGQLGYSVERNDSAWLAIRVVYDDRDTTIVIHRGQVLNNLELCALKMTAMQRRLQFQLTKYYGADFAFVNREDLDRILALGSRTKVLVDYPTIIPNNPNQEPFQVTMLGLHFARNVNWEPVIVKRKDRTKGNTDKATRKGQRDDFRDPVPGDDDE